MGLTGSSVGINAVDFVLEIQKQSVNDRVIALAGNPNVGKSTIFNNLTGLHQHTGNWPGKTVTNAQGYCKSKKHSYVMVDIPGTYSLMAHSAEEEVARNFICFGKPDAVVVVCDATCLERNMNLVLQTMEISQKVIVCVNLLDEAKRKNININLKELSNRLGVPVIGTVARSKKSISELLKAVDGMIDNKNQSSFFKVRYHPLIEEAISVIEPAISKKIGDKINSRWLSLRLLDSDDSLLYDIADFLGEDIMSDRAVADAVKSAEELLAKQGISKEKLRDMIASGTVLSAEEICLDAVTFDKAGYNAVDRKIDKFLTGRLTGYPVMILLLAIVFWITISGANVISDALSKALFYVQDRLTDLFVYLHAPDWLHGVVVLGIYRVLAWVVSVMLPPMAIFFPLFTLLEDSGYLPRIAYNLDKPFKKCSACGKQALTMCMGFGCNAAGVIG